jgi:hypothetical protein
VASRIRIPAAVSLFTDPNPRITLLKIKYFIQSNGSRSGRIRIILPDPDRYQFQFHYFSENVNILFKILKIVTPVTMMRKIKQCKLALLLIYIKNHISYIGIVLMPIRIRVCISIKMETRIRIDLKTMHIRN